MPSTTSSQNTSHTGYVTAQVKKKKRKKKKKEEGIVRVIIFFFFFQTLLSLPHTLPLVHSAPPSPPSFFQQDHRKILKNFYAPSHLLFKVKVSNLFNWILYAFAWGYFDLIFDNDIHVIYEFWKWYSCVYIYLWVLYWWNYLMSGFIDFTMMVI